MVNQHAYLAGYVDAITIRLYDKHLWFYRHFYKFYNNLTYQDHKPAWFNLVLQVMVASAQLGHVTNIALPLPLRPTNNQTWQSDRPVCTDFSLHVLASPPLGQMIFKCIFTLSVIFTCTIPTTSQT